jgi:homoserine O-succinyltransferase/O-acetyltransferase
MRHMPLFVDKNNVPVGKVPERAGASAKFAENSRLHRGHIRIALVNNMPDTALEDTEAQFVGLLSDAAGDLSIRLGFYFLPTIPRSTRAKRKLESRYLAWHCLRDERFDAVIITGTEPHTEDLRDEPYWHELSELFEWAEANTHSSVLSCLAAHAAVLHGDGIVRRARKEKQFGIFQETLVCEHPLTRGIQRPLRIPHSRCNGLSEADLSSCRYQVLTRSAEAGAGMFVKMRRQSLFVHFQGHPEYGPRILLKEYRRDVGRYLRGEREAYPSMPCEYFDPASEKRLADFKLHSTSKATGDPLATFPEAEVANALTSSWRPAAVRIYSNWLEYLAMRKGAKTTSAATLSDRPAEASAVRGRPAGLSKKSVANGAA